MSGAILETYLFSEILKTYLNSGVKPNLYFYRDKDQKEVDLLIEYDNCLYPVECKKTANPSTHGAKNFHVLNTLGVKIGHAVVFCLKDKPYTLSNNITALPINYI